jgi:hypothetical protein
MVSYRQLNNEGVSLLCAGRTRDALVKFSECLRHVKSTSVASRDSKGMASTTDCILEDVSFQLVHHTKPRGDRYVYNASAQIVDAGSGCEDTMNINGGDQTSLRLHRAKIMHIVLYNLALAHQSVAMETRRIKNSVCSTHAVPIRTLHEKNSCTVYDLESEDSLLHFRKALALYGLCRSSLSQKISGTSISDLVFLSIVILNNMGEVHREIEGLPSLGARSCSEELVQIFMNLSLNGREIQMAQELEDVLANAFQTLYGGNSAAQAA